MFLVTDLDAVLLRVQNLDTRSVSSAYSGIAIRLSNIRQQNIRSTFSPVSFLVVQCSSLCHSPVHFSS